MPRCIDRTGGAARAVPVCTAPSVSAEAARRLDAGQLVEIEIDNRLQGPAGGAIAKLSGSASSHAYSACSLRRVVIAACHCCGRLVRRIDCGRRAADARLPICCWR
jgi:hypothetical protein